jgi:hypothetical protein
MMSFADAMAEAKARYRTIQVLLGNGFSRACRDNIFAYGALFDRADFGALSGSAREAFNALRTRDFEVVIQTLRDAARVLDAYGGEPELRDRMLVDAVGLREVLVRAIANSHPGHPHEIEEERYTAARHFLSHFRRIYTLNYDLLLYWALMRNDVGPAIECDDGFRNSDDEDVDHVVWDPASSNREQNIYYVHGGLHLFDSGPELVKYTWSRTGVCLIDQVRRALEEGKYPLFVAEGSSDAKLDRIRHHAYLGRIERSFLEIGGALFVYGVSFGDSDNHVLTWIEKGKMEHLYVGVFGDPNDAANARLKARAQQVAKRRRKGKQPGVTFFDAASAHVWG